MTTYSEPVTLHVVMFIQGHHSNHSTEFILTRRDVDPKEPRDILGRIAYPGVHIRRDFIEECARQDFDTELFGPLKVHEPSGWTDHVSYDGRRSVES